MVEIFAIAIKVDVTTSTEDYTATHGFLQF